VSIIEIALAKISGMRTIASEIINDVVSQSWTIFGLLVGWIVLPDGETRNFVGSALFILCLAWAVTMPLRINRD
jgi:hypothetical protein